MQGQAVAFVYPGQGSQRPGMGREAHEAYAEARATFAEADDALGFRLSALCFEGSEEELRRTENAQPAILAVSVALHRVLAARGLEPQWVAGHSLGEYSALVAAGSLGLAEALRLVRRRGRYMQEAVPEGVGAMAAILGLEADAVEDLCRSHPGPGTVEVANLNAPGQVVVAGHRQAVAAIVERARERGARRAVLLNVSAPFHCSLMRPAAERLRADLEATHFADLRVPLVCNVDARPLREGAAAREALIRQVTAPVRWADSVRWMARSGVGAFVEVGPGTVLTGLIRRGVRGATCRAVDGPEGVESALAALAAVP